jgi:hypothetical protein
VNFSCSLMARAIGRRPSFQDKLFPSTDFVSSGLTFDPTFSSISVATPVSNLVTGCSATLLQLAFPR